MCRMSPSPHLKSLNVPPDGEFPHLGNFSPARDMDHVPLRLAQDSSSFTLHVDLVICTDSQCNSRLCPRSSIIDRERFVIVFVFRVCCTHDTLLFYFI